MSTAAAAAAGTSEGDRALDALLSIVRQLSPADPDESAEAERWLQHLALLAPPPGREHPIARRDVHGAAAFIRSVIANQRQALERALADCRAVAAAFSSHIAHALADDAKGDTQAREVVQRLDEAVHRGSSEQIRRAALEAVGTVRTVLDEKHERQRQRARELGTRMRSLRQELVEAKKSGELDPLTQLPNRRALDASMAEAKLANDVFDEPSCLLLIDLDRFKQVNDTWGHNAGDEVLRAVARELSLAFPRQRDCTARFGGEELAVVLRDAGMTDATRLAERVLARLRDLTVPAGDVVIRVTASVGVAQLQPGMSASEWIAVADRRLYRSKEEGRDRVTAV